MKVDALVSWIGIGVILFGGPFALWRVWAHFMTRLNGLGSRVGKLEKDLASTDGIVELMNQNVLQNRMETTVIQRDLGEFKANLATVRSEQTKNKDEILGAISQLQMIVLEKDALLRERVARIEAIQGIPVMKET